MRAAGLGVQMLHVGSALACWSCEAKNDREA